MSLYFNGKNAYVEVPHSESLNLDEWTVVARVKVLSLPSPSGGHFEITNKDWNVLRFFIRENTYKPKIVFNADGNNYSFEFPDVITLGEWHFLAGYVKSGEQGIVVDEKLEVLGNVTYTTLGKSDKELCIARALGVEYYSHGFIGSLRIYNTALTQSQIQELYENPYAHVAMDNCVLWLPFNENMGVVTKDYSGNSNHGRLYNCRWVHKARRGMYFDNGGMRFDSNFTIDGNSCSVVVICNARKIGQRKGTSNIVVPNNYSHRIYRVDDGKFGFAVSDLSGVYYSILTEEYFEDEMYTVCGIVDGASVKISVASSGCILHTKEKTDIPELVDVKTPLYIGSGTGTYRPIHGEILAVLVYNRPITEDEIRQISEINGWFNPPQDGLVSWVLFDGLMEGDTPVDKITGVEGVAIGTPKFVIRKPVRVLSL